MEPLTSKVNPHFSITKEQATVSLFNTGPVYAGHAMIVVERLDEQGKLVVGQYEVLGKIVVTRTAGEIFQRTLGNSQGYIAQIRIIEQASYTYPGDYADLASKSWYAKPEAVKKMIRSIKEQQAKIEGAIAQGKELSDLYQTAGSQRWWWLGGNGGESCLTWAEKKLRIAGIEPQGSWLDYIKAMPVLHVEFKLFN